MREVRIRYFTTDGDRPWVHWHHDNADEVSPAEILRLLAELGDQTDTWRAWVEYREIGPWHMSGGAELLQRLERKQREQQDVKLPAFLNPQAMEAYTRLNKAGMLDVLASEVQDVDGQARHAVTVRGSEQKVLYTSELEALIAEMDGEEEGSE